MKNSKNKDLIYIVVSEQDEDGGIGDAIQTTTPVIAFNSKKQADEYVKANNHPHIYGWPYDKLYTGGCHYEIVPFVDGDDQA